MAYKVVVVDTETGGLDPAKHSILSIAAAVLEDDEIIDQFYMYVNEGEDNFSATPEALKVNGLTKEAILDEGSPPAEVVEGFITFLKKNNLTKGAILAGHNVGFDIGFMRRLFRLANRSADFDKYISYRSLDTQSIAVFLKMAERLPDLNRTNLDSILKYLKIKTEKRGDHDALEDVGLTAKVLVQFRLMAKMWPDF